MDYNGCGSSSCKLVRPTGQHSNGPCRCREEIARLNEEVERLRAGLQPFAEYVDFRGDAMDDATRIDPYTDIITLGDCRHARKLLSQKG